MEEFYKTKIKEIMLPGRDTPFMEENASWAEFLNKLSLRAHAWVVNNIEEMKVVGVITEHDMLRTIIPPGQKKERMFGTHRAEIFCLKESVVQDIMTHNPVVCSPEEKVRGLVGARLFRLLRVRVLSSGWLTALLSSAQKSS